MFEYIIAELERGWFLNIMRFLISQSLVLKVATISCTGTMLNTMASVLGPLAISMVFVIKNHGPIRHYLSAVEEGNARIIEEHLSQKRANGRRNVLGTSQKIRCLNEQI